MDVEGDDGAVILRASYSSVISPGFLSVYSTHALKQSRGGSETDASGDDDRGGDEGVRSEGIAAGEEGIASAVESWSGAPSDATAVIAAMTVRGVKFSCYPMQ